MLTNDERLRAEAAQALVIVRGMVQDMDEIDRRWPASKRGSNADRVWRQLKTRREGAEACLQDGLREVE